MEYAYYHDNNNKWFCFLTESCVPIVTPSLFLSSFYKNYNKSIIKWDRARWNIEYHNKANLKYLANEFHLCNTPWFLLERNHVYLFLQFIRLKSKMFRLICRGKIANESIFAIILKYYSLLEQVINENSTIMDWSRMSSTTSPYVYSSKEDFDSIIEFKEKNKYSFFLRKIHKDFPDEILENILALPSISTINTSYKSSHWFIRRPCLHLIISTLIRMTLSTLESISRCYNICFIFIFSLFIIGLN